MTGLSVSLGAIVGHAEHLTVAKCAVAALAPRGYVIGFHVFDRIDFRVVCVSPPDSWGVGDSVLYGCRVLIGE